MEPTRRARSPGMRYGQRRNGRRARRRPLRGSPVSGTMPGGRATSRRARSPRVPPRSSRTVRPPPRRSRRPRYSVPELPAVLATLLPVGGVTIVHEHRAAVLEVSRVRPVVLVEPGRLLQALPIHVEDEAVVLRVDL